MGRLPVADAVDFVSQICEAVTHAHVKEVIHRDLKPDNVMLTADASGALVAKLIDFGLGKIIADNVQASTAWTKTGLRLGSAHYMSPELCGGGPAVPASDIYAVGCILFELIEGRPPFDADYALGVVYLQANASE
ncbi:MAG: serine/threonine protein kinase [Candidatus Obscuribacterales bacterium]|nr:serine/threonine protein kinase [Candidatus Obscuribacterales bacterium]